MYSIRDRNSSFVRNVSIVTGGWRLIFAGNKEAGPITAQLHR
jgi:hypothetical protein